MSRITATAFRNFTVSDSIGQCACREDDNCKQRPSPIRIGDNVYCLWCALEIAPRSSRAKESTAHEMSFLEIALACIARGWHVHPLKPGKKIPITPHGKNDATTDEEQIRAWWAQVPNANVGIACGPSGLCVLDIDQGLADAAAFTAWRIAAGLPETYTVRTGRRPEFGAQMYFSDPIPDVRLFELNGCSGQVKSLGGLVLAAGCLHPSGATYELLCDVELARTPDIVKALRTITPAISTDPGAPFVKIAEGAGRHADMTSQAGYLHHKFRIGEVPMLAMMAVLNDIRYEVPLSYEDLQHIARSIGNKPLDPPEAKIVFKGRTQAHGRFKRRP